MQQICDILLHKVKLMSNQRDCSQDTLQKLMIEKKKETLRGFIQTRLQQLINTMQFATETEIQQLLSKTYQIMLVIDPDLPKPMHQPPFQSLTDLFISFFKRQGCEIRANQIQSIHQKKLCPRAMFPSMMLNWLVEWVRKEFGNYLKKKIHRLYVGNRGEEINKRGQSSKTQQKQEKKEKQQENIPIIHQSSVLHPRKTIQVSSYHRNIVLEDMVSNMIQGHTLMSSISPRSHKATIEQSQNQGLPINKEIVFSAFSQEIQAVYRQLQDCIDDLDVTFAKRIRKNGRKEELRKRIKEFSGVFIKNMPIIKENIEKYAYYYNQKLKSPKKHKSNKSSMQISPDISPQTANPKGKKSRRYRLQNDDQQYLVSRQHLRLQTVSKRAQSRASMNFKESRRMLPVSKTLDIFLDLQPPESSHPSVFIMNSSYLPASLSIIEQRARKARHIIHRNQHMSLDAYANKKKKDKQKRKKDKQKQKQKDSVDMSTPKTEGVLRLPRIKHKDKINI